MKAISSSVPLGRFGTPDEIAKAVVFLASDDSSYITGDDSTSRRESAPGRFLTMKGPARVTVSSDGITVEAGKAVDVSQETCAVLQASKFQGGLVTRGEKIRNSHRQTHLSLAIVLFVLIVALASGELFAQSVGPTTDTRPTVIRRMVTQGLAKTVNENLFKCEVPLRNYRISAVGTITADDGTVLTVPANTAYQTGPKLRDLFNECNKTTPAKLTDVKPENVPIVEIDPDGEVITGYIVADNYFELYVNGKLIGVDPIPFTPFNSVIVRFKAKRPYTYALKAVDWEERPGLGMETNRGTDWHAGDGGLIARFSDGTVTDSTWRAQSFYIAPLARPDDVVENGNIHDTSKLGRVHPIAKVPDCRERCFAVHYAVPEDWASPDFNDSSWPRAYEFTDDDVGVEHIPAYTRYPEAFTGARWIWSYNLVFDNLVLARKTVP